MATNNRWPLQEEQAGPRRVSTAAVSEFEDDEDLVKSETLVVGTTNLYVDGKLRLIPMPTPDPKDPLNLPAWRKWTAIGALCFFGALALSAEIVIGGLLPVFILEYSGVDPRILNSIDFKAQSGGSGLNINPLSVVPPGVVPASLEEVSMLATIPLIANGIASYFLVPTSIWIGRRPVLIFAATAAWAGGLFAAFSTSLHQHLIARAIMGLGAGAVEALIPLIVQDLVFIHQRNKAMSAVISSQGIIIIALGVLAPWISSNYTWRWMYYITSGLGIVAWGVVIAFVPETRWTRSQEELSGQTVYSLKPGQNRPQIDYMAYTPRTVWTNIGVFQNGFELKAAAKSMLDALRSTYFPVVIWAVFLNTAGIVMNQASSQITPFALLAQGWEFQWTGLTVLPFFLASALVYVFGGPVADKISNAVTKWQGGSREPEHHLANLILPIVSGVAGCFVFGTAGEQNLHWGVLLFGSFLIVFAFLTLMTILNVFIVESYPQWAGPVLVNVSSLRIVIAFFLASKATVWIAEKGPMATFALYAEALIVLSLGLPVFYFWGKKIRQWTAGSVKGTQSEKEKAFNDGASV
ncbi:major facilitator superfamily transporter [Colletotrichum graminicola]|uniref:Major facilitator superfamily transporter n=1 Tax=Colletotrichum graminicola (strain M1.001 / M2 / FGSC 10212) TaxID=645133 RepID=E3QTZ3_COLGM|nr:major facilitator superfamily transporter [Colletotrichum graminicola M1.001]EFQ34331.1 major facilitator superfamily transporter [Colletotrichum graminicola M1.001]WDK22483.1 major facilitator superfamily transporter [Colletotrichum graminicola]